MRDFKRIDGVLDKMLDEETLKAFLNTSSQKIIDNIYHHWEDVEEQWYAYPDSRFGQLLCYLRLIPSLEIENHIWNIEEIKWLEKRKDT